LNPSDTTETKIDIHSLLERLVECGGSDLHLKAGSPPVLRVFGQLLPQEDFPVMNAENLDYAFTSITSEVQRMEFTNALSLDFAYSIAGLSRFRVNAIRQRGSLSLAFRFVPYKIPTMEELGLPEACKQLILKPRGLVLITGQAGSGKSTTLAAMVEYLNQNETRNVITIEDPIEFLFRDKKCLIHQRDLGDDCHSFADALIDALRHDPDVIIVGEMRDLETISTALTAAETGHLVLGTLHTNDASQTVDRIVDMFPFGQQRQVRLQLSQVIEGVVSQTLLPRTGGGRIAAFEVMLGTGVIRRLIREEKVFDIPANIEMAHLEGMQTLDQALADLVKNDLIKVEDAMIKSSNPRKLTEFLKPATYGFSTPSARQQY
jgi:twitching motility protein PilT